MLIKMRKIAAILVLFLSALSVAACSTREIESDPGIDQSTLLEYLENVQASALSQGAESSSLQVFQTLAANPNSVIYFAENGVMGPASTILSVSDLSYISSEVQGSMDDVESVRVFLVEASDESLGHRLALLVDFQVKGESERRVQVFDSENAGVSEDGRRDIEFFSGQNHAFFLRSYNVDDSGAFDPVIQVLLIDENSEQIGKLSVLVGFGG